MWKAFSKFGAERAPSSPRGPQASPPPPTIPYNGGAPGLLQYDDYGPGVLQYDAAATAATATAATATAAAAAAAAALSAHRHDDAILSAQQHGEDAPSEQHTSSVGGVPNVQRTGAAPSTRRTSATRGVQRIGAAPSSAAGPAEVTHRGAAASTSSRRSVSDQGVQSYGRRSDGETKQRRPTTEAGARSLRYAPSPTKPVRGTTAGASSSSSSSSSSSYNAVPHILGRAAQIQFESREEQIDKLLHEVLKDDKTFFHDLTAFGEEVHGLTRHQFWKTHTNGYDELFVLVKRELAKHDHGERLPVTRFMSEAEVPFRVEELYASFAAYLLARLQEQRSNANSLTEPMLETYASLALAETLSQINHTKDGDPRRLAIQVVQANRNTLIANAVRLGLDVKSDGSASSQLDLPLLAARMAEALAEGLSQANNLQVVIYDRTLLPSATVNAVGALHRLGAAERRRRVLALISDNGGSREDVVLTHMIDAGTMVSIQQARLQTGEASLESLVTGERRRRTMFVQLVAAHYALNTATASTLTSTARLRQLQRQVADRVQVFRVFAPLPVAGWKALDDNRDLYLLPGQEPVTKRARLLQYRLM